MKPNNSYVFQPTQPTTISNKLDLKGFPTSSESSLHGPILREEISSGAARGRRRVGSRGIRGCTSTAVALQGRKACQVQQDFQAAGSEGHPTPPASSHLVQSGQTAAQYTGTSKATSSKHRLPRARILPGKQENQISLHSPPKGEREAQASIMPSPPETQGSGATPTFPSNSSASATAFAAGAPAQLDDDDGCSSHKSTASIQVLRARERMATAQRELAEAEMSETAHSQPQPYEAMETETLLSARTEPAPARLTGTYDKVARKRGYYQQHEKTREITSSRASRDVAPYSQFQRTMTVTKMIQWYEELSKQNTPEPEEIRSLITQHEVAIRDQDDAMQNTSLAAERAAITADKQVLQAQFQELQRRQLELEAVATRTRDQLRTDVVRHQMEKELHQRQLEISHDTATKALEQKMRQMELAHSEAKAELEIERRRLELSANQAKTDLAQERAVAQQRVAHSQEEVQAAANMVNVESHRREALLESREQEANRQKAYAEAQQHQAQTSHQAAQHAGQQQLEAMQQMFSGQMEAIYDERRQLMTLLQEARKEVSERSERLSAPSLRNPSALGGGSSRQPLQSEARTTSAFPKAMAPTPPNEKPDFAKEGPPPPWEMHWSEEWQLHYFWNPTTAESCWKMPSGQFRSGDEPLKASSWSLGTPRLAPGLSAAAAFTFSDAPKPQSASGSGLKPPPPKERIPEPVEPAEVPRTLVQSGIKEAERIKFGGYPATRAEWIEWTDSSYAKISAAAGRDVLAELVETEDVTKGLMHFARPNPLWAITDLRAMGELSDIVPDRVKVQLKPLKMQAKASKPPFLISVKCLMNAIAVDFDTCREEHGEHAEAIFDTVEKEFTGIKSLERAILALESAVANLAHIDESRLRAKTKSCLSRIPQLKHVMETFELMEKSDPRRNSAWLIRKARQHVIDSQTAHRRKEELEGKQQAAKKEEQKANVSKQEKAAAAAEANRQKQLSDAEKARQAAADNNATPASSSKPSPKPAAKPKAKAKLTPEEKKKMPCWKHFKSANCPGEKECGFSHNEALRTEALEAMKKADEKKKAKKTRKVGTKDLKTVLCKFHKEGKCDKGTACPYSHDMKTGTAAEIVEEDDDEEEGQMGIETHVSYPMLSLSRFIEEIYDFRGDEGLDCKQAGSFERLEDKQADSSNPSGNPVETPKSACKNRRQRRTEQRRRMISCPGVNSDEALHRFILDSGASLHIFKRRKGLSSKKGIKFRIQTANGIVSSNLYHVVYIPNIGEIQGLALERTPDLLSMGKMIQRFRLSFIWYFYEYDAPYLLAENGDKIILKVIKDVPILDLTDIRIQKFVGGIENLAAPADADTPSPSDVPVCVEPPPGLDIPKEPVLPPSVAEVPKESEPLPVSKEIQQWKRIAKGAKRFRQTSGDGPSWDEVIKRETFDLDSGELIESIDVKQQTDDFDYKAEIPNSPRNIKTVLHFVPKSDENTAARRNYMSYCRDVSHLHGCKCDFCRIAKQKKHYGMRVPEESKEKAEKFGQIVMMDYYETNKTEVCRSVEGFKTAQTFYDPPTGTIGFIPIRDKSGEEVKDSIISFGGEQVKDIKRFYNDGARSYTKALKKLGIPKSRSAPYSAKTNAIMESKMYLVGDGIRVQLLRSGLLDPFWAHAGIYQGASICVTSPDYDAPCPYALRYPEKRIPTLHPFGCLVYVVRNKVDKAKSRGSPCIYLGPKVEDGGIIKDQEIVFASLDFWTNPEAKSLYLSTTRDFRFPPEVSFPVREHRLKLEYEAFKSKDSVTFTEFTNRLLSNLSAEKEVKPIGETSEIPVIIGDGNEDEEVPDELSVHDDDDDDADDGDEQKPKGDAKISKKQEDVLPDPVEGQIPSPVVPEPSSSSTGKGTEVEKDYDFFKKSREKRDFERAKAQQEKEEWIRKFREDKEKGLSARAAKCLPEVHRALIALERRSKVLVEFACSEDSNLGKVGHRNGQKIVRLTESDDVFSEKGFDKAKKAILETNTVCDLFGSLPCTPWTAWQHLNLHRLGKKFRTKLLERRKESLAMLERFAELARIVVAKGGTVSFEWPKACTGWRLSELQMIEQELGMKRVTIHGCMLGVLSKKGVPIKKPWMISSNSPSLIQHLEQFVCDNRHNHEKCEGSETKRSGFYPEKMSIEILQGLNPDKVIAAAPKVTPEATAKTRLISNLESVKSVSDAKKEITLMHLDNQISKAIRKAEAKLCENDTLRNSLEVSIERSRFLDSTDRAEHLCVTTAEILQRQVKTEVAAALGIHRDKLQSPSNILGLVTKLLTRRDPEYHTPEARDALLKEVMKLIQAGVWDVKAISKRAAAKKFSNAVFSRLFPILGIKNFDTQSPTYKGRVVVQGSDMRDGEGSAVFFQDCASAPTSMQAIRSTIAYGSLSPPMTEADAKSANVTVEMADAEATQADAEQAYIQRKLDPEENLFVVIPREMWSEEMKASAEGISDPVFRLLRPLYGWQRSGSLWEQHLEETLVTMKSAEEREADNIKSIELQMIETHHQTCQKISSSGEWVPVAGWPQTFMKLGKLGKPVILTVYVDDMIMAGPGHRYEWEGIRKLIRTTEPEKAQRILGVNYQIRRENEYRTKITMDMSMYTTQMMDSYTKVPNAPPLKPKVSFPFLEPTRDEIVTASTNPPGETIFGKCCASLLMKALYLARMVRLDVIFTINYLAKYVSKWNSICDKQLCHLFSYLNNTASSKLHATLDSRDLQEGTLELNAYPDADLSGCPEVSTRSTSGGFLALEGKYGTFVQLDWFSKRQSATSHSTTEAEMVSLSKMLRESLVPQMGLWANLIGGPIKGIVHEDNESTIVVAKSGYSSQLRHLAKHHRISLGLVHEFVSHPDIDLRHIDTNLQKGDLMTKGLTKAKHEAALELVQLFASLGVCVAHLLE